MPPALTPLRGVRVVEFGDRIAVGGCGSVLAALGADVILAEPAGQQGRNKWATGDAVRAGKRPLHLPDASLDGVLAGADVVLLSTDVSGAAPIRFSPAQVVCDITAYGSAGPLAFRQDPDALVQACSGLADTTGEPDGPPVLCGFPVAEGMAALYAAAGVIAALRSRTLCGLGQTLEVALFDSVFSAFAAFLPFPLTGQAVTRAGNRHLSCSPWNVYRARDGGIVICIGTDEQWQRLCRLMGRTDLAEDPALHAARDRVARMERVDAAVTLWTATLSAAEVDALLDKHGIPAGPILEVTALAAEPNLAHRGLLRQSSGRSILPSALRCFPEGGTLAMPAPAALAPHGNAQAKATAAVDTRPGAADRPPFAGLRVVELGQFTTAPFAARQLGALGADVLKVESPGGDASRSWNPHQDHQSYFFTLSNSDKQSVRLDLRDPAELAQFRALLASADVFIENLKPGSLARLGLAPADLAAINPRLIYCAISGFGADSAYPGRAAFDTVVQAMSGMMDLTRYNGEPQKVGISLADVLAGLFGLIGTSAALFARDTTGQGAHLDIAMQEAAAWITQWQPAPGAGRETAQVVRCSDGYAVVAGAAETPPPGMTRAAFVQGLVERGRQAAPVLGLGEVLASGQVRERGLVVEVQNSLGRTWPAFASPVRLGRTPPRIRRAIGPLGEANAGLAAAAPVAPAATEDAGAANAGKAVPRVARSA